MDIFKRKRSSALFEVHRIQDDSGISGTGHVIDGVVFWDGTTVIRWRSKTSSTAIFKSYRHFEKVHLAYHGRSEVKWVSGFDGVGFSLQYLRNLMIWLGEEYKKAPSIQKFPYAKVKQLISTKVEELGRFTNEEITTSQHRGSSQNSLQRIYDCPDPKTEPSPSTTQRSPEEET